MARRSPASEVANKFRNARYLIPRDHVPNFVDYLAALYAPHLQN
jgi:hypothetical protein